jgi:hypothetical protein
MERVRLRRLPGQAPQLTARDPAPTVAPQYKLELGRRDDPLERQAEDVAAQVSEPSVPAADLDADAAQPAADDAEAAPVLNVGNPDERRRVQRSPSAGRGGPDAARDLESTVGAGLRGGGRPLDPSTRVDMEARLGHRFDAVRVHSDEHASASAQALDARAYTVGRDIVFGSGQYAPETQTGRQLLAHELTHVVQQRAVARTEPLIQRAPPDGAPPAPTAPPAAGPGSPEADKEQEEKEKRAFDAANARAGQPAATVFFNSENQRVTDKVVKETFFLAEAVARPTTEPRRYGFDTAGAATAFIATFAADAGAVVQQDGFFFGARLKPGDHKLRVTDPTITEWDWWAGRDYVYRVDPATDIRGVTGMNGYRFPLNVEIEPDAAKTRPQTDPKMAKPSDANDMRQIAGILPDSAKPGEKPKMDNVVDIPEEQYESFIISYFRARGLETLETNEKLAADLTEKFKPTPAGPDGKQAGGLSPEAKALIDESRRSGVLYRDLMDKEAELEAQIDYMEAKKKQGFGLVTDWDVTYNGQTKKRTAWVAGFRQDQDDLKQRINNILTASPLLAQMVERQDPKKRFEGNVAPDFTPSVPAINKNNPYDRSLLAAPASAENDEKIRQDFLTKLDAARKAIRAARSDVVQGEADFLLSLTTLRQRVEIDLGRLTGKNKGLAEKLTLMTQNKEATDKIYETGTLAIQAALLFVPGGQFLSAAAGFVASTAQMNARLQVWNASNATLDPARGLTDQQEAETAALNATFRLAVDVVLLAVGVNSALEAGEAGKVPEGMTDVNGNPTTPQIDFGKRISSGGQSGVTAQTPGCGVFEGSYPGARTPVVIKMYPASEADLVYMHREMEAARAAEATGRGPRVYGEVRGMYNGNQPRVGFAMEKVEGNMTIEFDEEELGHLTPAERAKALSELQAGQRAVTRQTVQDVRDFGDRLWSQGYYCQGDLQGLVDAQGRWRPIDFQTYGRITEFDPAPVGAEGSTGRSSFERNMDNLATHRHWVEAEAQRLQAIAEYNHVSRLPNPNQPR